MSGLADVITVATMKPRHAGAVRATATVVEKELRILRRDWVGICLLILAPIVVISVAGFSLAKVYGGDAGAHILPLVDEDHGEVAKAIADALAAIKEVDLRAIDSRAEAERMVRDRGEAAAALVIPAGTTTRLSGGGRPQLLFYTDPVKLLEIVNFKLLISEVLRRVSAAAVDRARSDGIAAAGRLRKELEDGANASADLRASLVNLQREALRRQAQSEKLLDRQLLLAQERIQEAIDQQLARVGEQLTVADESQRAQLTELRDYFMRLAQAREQFGQWFMRLRDLAGSRASEIPPPPEFPSPPADIENFSSREDTAIDVGKIRSDPNGSITLSGVQLAWFSLPSVSSLPEFSRIEHLPKIDHLTIPSFSLPGSIGFREENLTGASPKVNIFDQEVPGFRGDVRIGGDAVRCGA
jgi:hypothetical protein